MDLSVKQVARILDVSEATVRNYIASGKLSARKRGRQVVVSKEGLDAFSSQLFDPPRIPAIIVDDASIPQVPLQGVLGPIEDRMKALESQMERLMELTRENQRLSQELRQRDLEIAQKELDIEKLRRDLVCQTRVHEKEMEDHQKRLEEKWILMEKEAAERIAREREHLDDRLVQERDLWSGRLAQEKEHFARKLTDLSRQEGFWSRLLKMMTWS